jgi:hypothetical protein
MMVLPLFLIKKQAGNQIKENWIRLSPAGTSTTFSFLT